MDNAIYAALTRQSGLMNEMRVVANNLANANTTGFRREGVIFAEHLNSLDNLGETLSMGHARGRRVALEPGAMTQTGGAFDLAIEGEGLFMVETPQGNRMTRAGAFIPSAEGELMTPDGFRLLDEGQAPIVVPAGAGPVAVGGDGTMSANGVPFAKVGVFAAPADRNLTFEGGTVLVPPAEPEPLEASGIRQGFLEASNVDPLLEIARMIEVQRAYEMGQSFLEREDQRIRSTITAMSR